MWASGFGIGALGCRVSGLGPRVQGILGFRVQGLGLRAYGPLYLCKHAQQACAPRKVFPSELSALLSLKHDRGEWLLRLLKLTLPRPTYAAILGGG